MNITYFRVKNGTIAQDNKAEDCSWVNINTDDRNAITDYYHQQHLSDDEIACLTRPDEHHFLSTFNTSVILNLCITIPNDIYNTTYISILIKEGKITTITEETSVFYNERVLSTYSEEQHFSLKSFLFHLIALRCIAQGNIGLHTSRQRLQDIEETLSTNADKLSSQEIMSCERDISKLSDIIEDQYINFKTITSAKSIQTNQKAMVQANKTVDGFDPINKAMLRLEKKAESLRLQYMLIQQEKSTKKINVLTIIQAIFVPLTFIAGVYGMNFINMPELNWPLGYLFVWIAFIILALGLLHYFYRKGWFR